MTGGKRGDKQLRRISEPGKRDTGRWHVFGSELPLIPEVGAVCGKAARTDLCGGCEVTRIPTAT
jgi:hypothetical protein